LKISIVIPVYNQARYIAQAVESALAQTHAPLEVVVVDDGSTDGTAEVCAGFGDRIVRHRQENAGPSAARNTGLRLATGDAVVLLDGDDLLEPRWVEQAVRAYGEARGRGDRVGAVYPDYVIFDDAGRYETPVRIRRVGLPGLLRDPLLIPSGCLVTRAFLRDVGEFNTELPTCEDWEFWLRGALLGYRFVRVETLGFRHREHGSSLSKQEIPALEGRVKFLRLWADDARLDARQRDAMREELSRTLLRLRRARWFGGLPAEGCVAEALRVNPRAAMDPWLFVFGAVYAAPFFRAQLDAERVRASIRAMEEDVLRHLESAGPVTGAMRRRLRAGAAIALAADRAFGGLRARAGAELVRALVADPTLVLDPLRRSSRYTAEVARVSGMW
jgi:glycosyltransferase involved in cell wall biosynthesis